MWRSTYAVVCLILSATALQPVCSLQTLEDWWPFGKKHDHSVSKTTEGQQTLSGESNEVVEGYPSKPGCYMRMPSGCPKRPMKTHMWRHDTWAEKHSLDESACKERKHVWDRYCESDDAKMAFVGNGASPASLSGLASENIAMARSEPLSALHLLAMGGKSSRYSKSVPEAQKDRIMVDSDVLHGYPSQPGCYTRMPSGCPNNPKKTHMWRHDLYAEQHGLDEKSCKQRKHAWDKECGVDDVKIVFIGHGSNLKPEGANQPGDSAEQAMRQESEDNLALLDSYRVDGYPFQPGCYVQMPSGCPENPKNNTQWMRDSFAEVHHLSEWSCNMRKHKWEYECRTQDVKILFIGDTAGSKPAAAIQPQVAEQSQSNGLSSSPESEPAASARDIVSGYPSQPGCYMRMPSGCPNNPKKTHMWRHDLWAEQHSLDEKSCKQRKRAWDKECGVDDVKMVFVGNGSSLKPDLFGQPGEREEPVMKPVSQEDRAMVETDVIRGYPSQPGCYVRMPSGCPNNQKITILWRRDKYAEGHHFNKQSCNMRKHKWDQECGTEDAKMLFIDSTSSSPEGALQPQSS